MAAARRSAKPLKRATDRARGARDTPRIDTARDHQHGDVENPHGVKRKHGEDERASRDTVRED